LKKKPQFLVVFVLTNRRQQKRSEGGEKREGEVEGTYQWL
jgi:hypothetical protein